MKLIDLIYKRHLLDAIRSLSSSGYDFATLGTEPAKTAINAAVDREDALLAAIEAHLDDKRASAGTRLDYSGYSDAETVNVWKGIDREFGRYHD